MRATTSYRVSAGLSTKESGEEAAAEASAAAGERLDGARPDVAFLFMSAAHLDEAAEAADAAREQLAPAHLLGCVAEGVIGRDREIEEGPALAVWAAALPGTDVETFHAAAVETDDGVAIAGFPKLVDPSLVTLLVDPFSFPVGPFLGRLNDERPGLPLVGGLAAGGRSPGAQALIVDDEVYEAGAVGAVLTGVPVRTVVSQGCAPIGRDAVITAAEGNVIHELAGERALDRLRAELLALPPEHQRLAAGGLLAGLVIDENRSEYRRGDYLMRGLLGADEEAGSIAVGEAVRVGQTLRFHVRDAAAADEDLRLALEREVRGERTAGALLFTCNGRGTHMFSSPGHDATAVADAMGSDVLAGFFCGGEIGPVGGRVFLHGFTATLAVFLEPAPQ